MNVNQKKSLYGMAALKPNGRLSSVQAFVLRLDDENMIFNKADCNSRQDGTQLITENL